MKFAIQCRLAKDSGAIRIALHSEHLRYILSHQEQIFCGGPTIDAVGNPEMMLIILNAPDLAAAEAFINAEPYNRASVFDQVTVRLWRQVLPETEAGELLHQIERD